MVKDKKRGMPQNFPEDGPVSVPKDVEADTPILLPENSPKAEALPPVFWDPDWRGRIASPSFFKSFTSVLTPAHLYYLAQETEFDRDPDSRRPELESEEEQNLVGRGLEECPMCHGTEEVSLDCVGRATGIRVQLSGRCSCHYYKLFARNWFNPRNVPSDYQECTMGNVWSGCVERFRKEYRESKLKTIRAVVTEHPNYPMLISGPSGAGKTTLMSAMYNRALREWVVECAKRDIEIPAVWKERMADLMGKQIAYMMKDKRAQDTTPIEVPVLSENVLAVRELGMCPHLFLDELEKYKTEGSDHQNIELHKLVDAVQSNGGQVVGVSNYSWNWFQAKAQHPFGPAIVRRLIGKPRGIYIEFWTGRCYVNLKEVEWNEAEQKLVPTGVTLPFAPEKEEDPDSVRRVPFSEFANADLRAIQEAKTRRSSGSHSPVAPQETTPPATKGPEIPGEAIEKIRTQHNQGTRLTPTPKQNKTTML